MVKEGEIVARLVPQKEEKQKRKIGLLDGTAGVKFTDDFKITEEMFLGL